MSETKKVKVDPDKCIGCGTCVSYCPECFVLEGAVSTVKEDCENCSCDLKEVAEACPVGAITVE
jgi:ferredoxin